MKEIARFFLTLDMLGDIERSGPIQWQVKREIADSIVNVIKSFMEAIKEESKQLDKISSEFPAEAVIYRYINRRNK